MKKVLFTALNSTGHINPLVGIANRLKQDHGYDTIFLLMGETTSTSISENGHELMIIDQNTGEFRRESKLAQQNDWNEAMEKMFKIIRLNPVEMLPQILHTPDSFGYLNRDQWARNNGNYAKAIEFIKPDLIVLDTWIVPPCILAMKHIPWVYFCSTNPFTFLAPKLEAGIKPPRLVGARLYNKEERERMRREEPDRWMALLKQWKELNEKVEFKHQEHLEFNKLHKDYGFEPMEQSHLGYHSPYLNLYLYPKEVDYDLENDLFEYPPRWFRCNHLIRSPKEEQVEFWSKKLDEAMVGKTEMIYFSLGTLASGNLELMRHYLDIFKEDKKRLYVVSKGPKGDKIELAENMIGANYLPQTFFLEKANLGIIHGGNNSFTECLYFGLPMIVLPCYIDQHDNAQRVEDLKLGRIFAIHRCHREEMLASIEDILNDKDLIKRTAEIGKLMKSRDDVGKVSILFKRLIEEKQLNEDFIHSFRS